MPGELPQFYVFPRSHGNIYFLPNEKEARKQKESCFYIREGEVSILVHFPKVREHPWLGSRP
jgi:hypothetical protein